MAHGISDSFIPGGSGKLRLRAVVDRVAGHTHEHSATSRAAAIAFAVRVASAALLYLSQVAMARWMGTYEYGIYVLAWTWVMILGGLAHGGLGMGVIRLLPEYRENGEIELERGLLVYGRWISFALSTALTVLAGAILWLCQDWISSIYVWPLFLALFCVPMFSLTEVQDGIGRANSWMVAGLVPPYILRPLILLLAMAGVYAAGITVNAMTAVGAAIVSTWLAGTIQLAMVQRRIPDRLKTGKKRVDAPRWAAMSLPMLIIAGSEMLLQYTDVLVVSAYLPPDQVGIYFASAKTMALILFVQYAVGSASANRFAAHHARGDTEALARSVRHAVRWTFWPSLICALIILALGKPILSLFGTEFVEGYTVMFILVLGYLTKAAMGPSEFLLNMAGQQVAGASIYVVCALANVGLNLVLVPYYGLTGAAASTAIAVSAAAMLNGWMAQRRLGLRIAVWSPLTAALSRH